MIPRDPSNIKRQRFLTAAQNDRFLNVFEVGSTSLVGSLRTEAEVRDADFAAFHESRSPLANGTSNVDSLEHPEELLAIVNKDGLLELYPEPFEFPSAESTTNASSAKKRMTQRTRKSAFQFCFIRESPSKPPIGLLNVQINGEHITVALVEGGSLVVFETLHWQGRTQAFTEICVTQGQNGQNLAKINGVKTMDRTQIDESHAVISNGVAEHQDVVGKLENEVIDISSAEEESEASEDDQQSWNPPPGNSHNFANGMPARNNDVEPRIDDDGRSSDFGKMDTSLSEDEPSFGERLRSAAPDPIDVADVLAGAGQQMLVPIADQTIRQLPPGVSLSTVLTQSLRTNDKDLLQTCFQIKDMSVVRATIERLDSSFAPSLVQRLVERFHSRPGRAGSLMVWIQWTLAAHGGYLTSKPEVMKNLVSLRRVVQERANSLPLLLSLKGKLDLLEAQKDLREGMHLKARALGDGSEEQMVYVEGQSESESELDEAGEGVIFTPTHTLQSREAHAPASPTTKFTEPSDAAFSDEGDADSGNEMPLANGDVSTSAEDSDGSESQGFFDEEASSTDQDSEDDASEEVDHDDLDTGSSDGADSPPAKRRVKVSEARRG